MKKVLTLVAVASISALVACVLQLKKKQLQKKQNKIQSLL